ncbi:MAG: hypothetical protein JW778_08275 [Candidatus Altiarchaeota archaeon]|nr:hypothetical protein [Candidatus Altiarchaeota archaeon]
MNVDPKIKGWIRDICEVIVVLALIIILSKLLLGPKMLIPLVAVTSESMLHTSDDWQRWLLSHNISEDMIASFPIGGGFAKGDMIVTITPDGGGTLHGFFSDTRVGDVVIYERDKQHSFGAPPIIHRVVGVVEVKDWSLYSTEGSLDCLTVEGFLLEYIPHVKGCSEGERCSYARFPKSGDFSFYVTKGDNNRESDQCSNIALPVTDAQLTARGWIVIPYLGWLKLILNVFIPL